MRISLKNGIAITNLSAPKWISRDLSARRQLGWKPEFDIFFAARKHRNRHRSDAPQGLDHVVYQYLRCRGPGGDADSPGVFQPFRIQLATIGNQVTRDADFGADFAQPVRIGAIGG